MKTVEILEAKARFFALVDAAEKGVAHARQPPRPALRPDRAGGRWCAPLSAGDAQLANYLLALPESLSAERDTTPLRCFDGQ